MELDNFKIKIIQQIMDCKDPELLKLVGQMLTLKTAAPDPGNLESLLDVLPTTASNPEFSNQDLNDLQTSINEIFQSDSD